jgi:diaminopimelate decarboxylase
MVNEKPMLEEIRKLLDLSRLLEKRFGTKISSFNLGGGFPEGSYLKPPALKRLLEQIRDAIVDDHDDAPLELVFEPGRFLVADAGIVISKANQVKKPLEGRGNGDPWLMLNAGINVINPISKARNRFLVANHMNDSYNTTFNICGSLPTRIDVFTKHYPLPAKTAAGDDIIITNAGAYTIPFLMHFCVKPPKIMIINQG